MVRGAPGGRSGLPPFAGRTLPAETTTPPVRIEPDRNGRPDFIWRGATAPGRSTPSVSACRAVVIRCAFVRSGFRTPHRVHRIPPRDL